MTVRALSMRESSLAVLTVLSLLAVALFAAGTLAETQARRTLAAWDAARRAMPGVSCGVCGRPARYDVSRLVRRQTSRTSSMVRMTRTIVNPNPTSEITHIWTRAGARTSSIARAISTFRL